MTKVVETRKSRFRAALALAGLTAEEWAAKQDVTPGHLSMVLSGRRESLSLCEKIDAFARQHLGDVGIGKKAVKRVVAGHGA